MTHIRAYGESDFFVTNEMKGGDIMFEIKKVTQEHEELAEINGTYEGQCNPPCSPEVGNCQPSAECDPAKP